MTFAEAQRRIGMKGKDGRRLKAYVFRREQETGKRIAMRLGSERMPKYRLTMSLLRRHCSELFPSKVQQLERNMRSYISGLDERINEKVVAQMAEHMEPRLEELWERDEIIAEKVDELGDRVTQLVRRRATLSDV